VNLTTAISGSIFLDRTGTTTSDTTIINTTGINLDSSWVRGNLNLTATTGNITNSGAVTVGGTANLSAQDDVTLSADFTTAGTTTINADTNADGTGNFTVDSGKILSTTNNTLGITANSIALYGNLDSGNGAITLTANDIDLTGRLLSGNGTTTLDVLNGGTIGLGDAVGTMTISGAELENITAQNLIIGAGTNGNIVVDGISAANSNNISGNLTLNAPNVTFSNTPSTFNALVVNAGNDVSVQAAIATDLGNITITPDSDGDRSGVLALNADITTADRDINLNGNVLLDSSVALNTGDTGGGNINITGTLNGTSPGGQNLTLTVGSGNITV
jgi:hypothetical protein